MQINDCDDTTKTLQSASNTDESLPTKVNRGKKRKRISSQDVEEAPLATVTEAESSDNSIPKDKLEDNLKKSTKKLITNDHVFADLALVELSEKEDLKLTRSKVKELKKVREKEVKPNSALWDLEKLELIPIKHIPVKTRPEVEALIAQELPEDEDDDEYQPTHEDVPSDDDQALESCSDLESQPHTPATPKTLTEDTSPQMVDGAFKVPKSTRTAARRKLQLEENEATIALRTRSKLSLSSTPIEHIESSFVPPDDLPVADVDDLWNQFLEECLNPAPPVKHEDDDEADPEYSVAADDSDAHDEDEALEKSIVKISKKELNDLITELFNIMPESETTNNEGLTDSLAKTVKSENHLTSENNNGTEVLNKESKEIEETDKTIETGEGESDVCKTDKPASQVVANIEIKIVDNVHESVLLNKMQNVIQVSVEEADMSITPSSGREEAPPLLRMTMNPKRSTTVEISIDESLKILPEQISILQQQLRQHIQLATSNFLQLHVHPAHWKLAPTFKEYLESFQKLGKSNTNSVVNVCNLKPACELIDTWEKTVSENTPQNKGMVEFIQNELEKSRRRLAQNTYYQGEFHFLFKHTVANSTVFLYPYLLPPTPFRQEPTRRFSYLRTEDELIALGLSEFWQYVDMNPDIFKPPPRLHPRHRWGLTATCVLVCKYMFPWLPPSTLNAHIRNARRVKDNPITKFFEKREVTPVQHVLLPFNPKLNLYQQPEHEMPRIWVRYLGKTNKRFKDYLYRRTNVTGMPPPQGVKVNLGNSLNAPEKKPLSIDFFKTIPGRSNTDAIADPSTDIQANINMVVPNTSVPNNNHLVPTNIFSMVQTDTGTVLVPLMLQTQTVESNAAPISSVIESKSNTDSKVVCDKSTKESLSKNEQIQAEHCPCCVLLRRISKQRQTVITEYFKDVNVKRTCPCKGLRFPRITNKLKRLLENYESLIACKIREVRSALYDKKFDVRLDDNECSGDFSDDDEEIITRFLIKLDMRLSITKNRLIKKRLFTLLSNFKRDKGDPVKLSNEISNLFDFDMVDIHKEFMAFLNPMQADIADNFKDHFVITCASKIIKRITECVQEPNKREEMLSRLNAIVSSNMLSPCQMCTTLLSVMHGYPKLASFVFNLFPHRDKRKLTKETKFEEVVKGSMLDQKEIVLDTPDYGDVPTTTSPTGYDSDNSSGQLVKNEAEIPEITKHKSEKVNDNVEDLNEDDAPAGSPPGYEADTSSEEEDTKSMNKYEIPPSPEDSKNNIIVQDENTTSSNYVIDTAELTNTKTEIQDPSNISHNSSNIPMRIVFEDDIKTETPDWTRQEDKVILQVLIQSLSPEERVNKTIREVIEEKGVVEIVSQSLAHKSMSDISERIFYLIEILTRHEH